jgi:predicted ATP-grasp superfamily ATP-dependent carboligase
VSELNIRDVDGVAYGIEVPCLIFCCQLSCRWSIMVFEKSITIPTRKLSHTDPALSIAAYEDSMVSLLTKILQSDEYSDVISAAK